MFTWVKKIAVGFAANKIKDYAKVDNINKFASTKTNALLEKVIAGKDAAELAKVANTCENVAKICAKVAGAIKDGKITQEEAAGVVYSIHDAFADSPLTDAKLSELVDSLAAKIIEKIS